MCTCRCPFDGVGLLFAYTWEGLILRPGVLVLLNTPGLKISPPQVYVHNQPTPSNGHLQVNIGHSGHALNSEHVLRES